MKPAKWIVDPEVDPDQQWSRVRAGMQRRARRRRVGRVAGAAVALGAAVILWSSWWVGHDVVDAGADAVAAIEPPTPRPASATDDPSASQIVPDPAPSFPPIIRLADGSTVVPAADARVRLCRHEDDSGCVVVDSGVIEFQVVPQETGHFEVRAGRVSIRVIGTRFTVSVERRKAREWVEVAVQSGKVEVSAGPDERQVLGAGDVWSLGARGDDPSPEPAGEPPAPSTNDSGRPAKKADGAEVLWARARDQRRAGNDKAAAQAYEKLLRDHPRDSRAGLAAMELGRLRMDSFGNPKGAVAPLERAVSSGGSIREDALARLVRALDASGRTEACLKRRQQYLREYPKGVHRPALESSCTNEG